MRVKANKGAAGVDGENLETFEANLKNNLYKIWNRMSSGSYFPPAVKAVETRFAECGLELHPIKTRIVYCKDDDRRGNFLETTFDFLGYTFRPRRSKNKDGKFFINFTPAVSNKAKKAMQQAIHDWRMHLKPDKSLEDLSYMFNPVLRGWVNYYGRFYKSEMYSVLKHMNRALVRWARRKYKKLAIHQRRADAWLGRIARREQKLFVQWQMGVLPGAG